MLKFKVKLSVKVRLFISYIVIFFICFFFLGILGYNWITKTVKENQVSIYQNVLNNVVENIDNKFEELDKFVLGLGETDWVKKIMFMHGDAIDPKRLSWESFREYIRQLEMYRFSNHLIDEICILYPEKDLVMASLGSKDFKTFFKYDFIVKEIDFEQWNKIINEYNRARIITNINVSQYNNVNKRSGIVYIQTLPAFFVGLNKATIVIFINNNSIIELLNVLFSEEGVNIEIFDQDGNVFNISKSNGKIVQFINKSDEANSSFKSYEDLSRHKNTYEFLKKSIQLGWTYIIRVPNNVIMVKVNQIKYLILVIMSVFGILGVIGAYRMAILQYRPLQRVITLINEKLLFKSESLTRNEYYWIERTVSSILEQERALTKRLEQHKPTLQNVYLCKLLEDNTNEKNELVKTLNLLDISFIYPFFTCIVLSNSIHGETLHELILHSIEAMHICAFVADIYNTKVIIMNHSINFDFEKLYSDLERNIKNDKEYNQRIVIGIGKTYKDVNNIYKSYQEGLSALSFRELNYNKIFIHYDQIDNLDSFYYYPIEKEKQLSNCLKTGDYSDAVKILNELHKKNIDCKVNLQSVRNFYFNLQLTILKIIKEMCLENYVKMNIIETSDNEDVYNTKMHILNLLSTICNIINEHKELQKDKFKDDLLEYINKKYNDPDLSLTSLAVKFNVSTSYISIFFKENYKSNFLDYINNKRIEYAKELLKNENMDIKDVALKVGYYSDVSFRRVFKRYEMVSPSKYKEMAKVKKNDNKELYVQELNK